MKGEYVFRPLISTDPRSRVPGDFGYDPLGLSKDPEAFKWYQQAELIHGRLAMMGLAGMLIPSVNHITQNTQKMNFRF